jgi:hypothetical protein
MGEDMEFSYIKNGKVKLSDLIEMVERRLRECGKLTNDTSNSLLSSALPFPPCAPIDSRIK